jgi:2-phosphoglycolate phosphatase
MNTTSEQVPPSISSCKAVVYDLDGTLVDSYEAIAECFNHARTTLGERALSLAEVTALVGHGLETLMEDAVGAERMPLAVNLFRERYDVICEERTTLLPGVAATLHELASRGLRQGVATNKPARFARRILRHLNLMPPLTAVLGPDDGIPAKPNGQMLRQVLAELKVPPGEALYVGDMTIDVETARDAGVAVWVLPTGSCTREQLVSVQPDHIFTSMDQLPGLLQAASFAAGA